MLGDRHFIAVLGLSRGGTNHLAQRIHACEGVVGLTEGVSRLIQPTRDANRQILTAAAVEQGILKPTKSLESARCVCTNKVNYTLITYPESWIKFLTTDPTAHTVILLRNPLMVHRSRLRFVHARKPQRRRWLDPQQLARELLELLAMTWHLRESTIVFHEQSLVDGYLNLLRNHLDLVPSTRTVPDVCPDCGCALQIRPRFEVDGADWLHCGECDRFIEGEGHYNYVRCEDDIKEYQEQERGALDASVIQVLREMVGSEIIDLFIDGIHWTDDGRRAIRQALNDDADRWRAVPLNEILYPY